VIFFCIFFFQTVQAFPRVQIDEDNVLDETTGQSLVDSEELIDVIVVAGEGNDGLAFVALISKKRDNFINGFFGQCTVFQPV